MPRGFLLQSTLTSEAGRPIVLLYGRLEDGRTFLVRDGREAPAFFVRSADIAGVRAAGATVVDDAARRSAFDDGPVARVIAGRVEDVAALHARLRERGIRCYEADVRLPARYRIDRGLRSGIEVEGPGRPGAGVDVVFVDPEVRPADVTPTLRVLSLDIETDPSATRLLSVALATASLSTVLLVTPRSGRVPEGAVGHPGERALLLDLVARVREIDPDVLTGWNVIDFDLGVLERVARRVGVPLALGRGPQPLRLRPAGARGAQRAFLPGRLVLDGIDLVRGAFLRFESYALDAVAREVLGRGKSMHGPDRGQAILQAYEHDPQRFVEYNLLDARLVLDVLDRLRLVDLAIERSRLTGQPLDRVAASIASFEFLYLSALAQRGLVGPSASEPGTADVVTSGGHVLEPRPGLYRNVLVFDFKSLYPSIIRTFQIDPLGHVAHPPAGADLIVAPNGAAFRREPGILPQLLDELVPRREAAQAAGNAVAAQAIKILMNSFYGVLGTSACRFATPTVANAITGFGREVLSWTQARIEAAGFEVLYGDTDSLFIRSAIDDPAAARECGRRLAARLTEDLARHVAETWRVTSRLELRFDRLYLRLLLASVRGGGGGARKRYAGLVEEGGRSEVVLTGLEAVRRDWTPLARRVQRELYERLFRDREVAAYLREIVADLRAGRLDDQLVYRRVLRKELEAYTVSTPPHVAAARRLGGRRGRSVAYVMTTCGPRPASDPGAPIDHEHYVERQIRPVAEPILALLGLDFGRVVGDDAQLRLF